MSRKIIHIGTGPIFVLCWPLFENNNIYSRFFAASVPLLITIQFFLVGAGIIKDQASVDSMSRSGDRKEILRGPLYYGIVFVLLTIFFWKDSLIGIIALMLMCGGDGLADIIGSRIQSINIPWAKNKTLAGTIAVFVGGWIFCVFVIFLYQAWGIMNINTAALLLPITVISLTGALVESLPFRDIDNITVPLASILLSFLILR
ncbi:MAG: phosphatidate cytidylyltransferase [Anaerolineae bacterium]|nr:phosphatidate cytidylyltransferase [Anaerolineae bacterium]